jgi:hypothetical protein
MTTDDEGGDGANAQPTAQRVFERRRRGLRDGRHRSKLRAASRPGGASSH